ncbi:MAG: glycerol-3-phosphate acyltransferase [Clostridiales bacterium]|nr:glycerol-3-phosphate acyltransferase [Clostridiales bacterium]
MNLSGTIFFVLAGYLSGSILFARLFGQLLKGKDITAESRDGNPGTANAFLYGGFWCGVLTLCGDLAKGFLPVYPCTRYALPPDDIGLAFVLAAPVVGHIFPLFFHFRGGKGIATSFGCLLGLLPNLTPVACLAVSFLFYSLVIRITPHYYRTILTYLTVVALMLLLNVGRAVVVGFGLMTAALLMRMVTSQEEHDSVKVRLLWMR